MRSQTANDTLGVISNISSISVIRLVGAPHYQSQLAQANRLGQRRAGMMKFRRYQSTYKHLRYLDKST